MTAPEAAKSVVNWSGAMVVAVSRCAAAKLVCVQVNVKGSNGWY
ncbi:MAG: hypothetical protein QOG20_5486 [Pseudonocardiales bacterium]|nr:hypothetical protein [Pseudonocardiales bacterium]